jgi:hypothetical protein
MTGSKMAKAVLVEQQRLSGAITTTESRGTYVSKHCGNQLMSARFAGSPTLFLKA